MKDLAESIWRPSPCTIQFTSPKPAFERTARFRLFSIYARDDVNKQKKVFNDIEKPQLLLQRFRRQIEEANSNRFKNSNRERLRSLANNARRRHNQTIAGDKPSLSTTVTNRLYQPQPKVSIEHDFFGNRSHFTQKSLPSIELRENPEESAYITEAQHTKKKSSSIFTEARRLDLGKPLNFFPGPGAYSFETAYLKKQSSTRSRFRSKSSFMSTLRTSTEMNNTHHA